MQGLLLKGPRLIIPSAIRLEILDRIHDGHKGIVKCRRRTKDSVSWLGLGKQLDEMVSNCRKCIEHRKPNSEPMTPSAVPARPWQVLWTDLFSLNGRTYLSLGGGLLLALHRNINTAAVPESETIRALKSIFTRNGISHILRSDNGPQFVSTEFDESSKECSFTCDFKHKDAAGQGRSRASRTDHKECTERMKEKGPAKALTLQSNSTGKRVLPC